MTLWSQQPTPRLLIEGGEGLNVCDPRPRGPGKCPLPQPTSLNHALLWQVAPAATQHPSLSQTLHSGTWRSSVPSSWLASWWKLLADPQELR